MTLASRHDAASMELFVGWRGNGPARALIRASAPSTLPARQSGEPYFLFPFSPRKRGVLVGPGRPSRDVSRARYTTPMPPRRTSESTR